MSLDPADKDAELFDELQSSPSNVDAGADLRYNVDGCSCMSCRCFKSGWEIVLSPAGVAAGLAAFSAASLADLGGG